MEMGGSRTRRRGERGEVWKGGREAPGRGLLGLGQAPRAPCRSLARLPAEPTTFSHRSSLA